jgi:hypothetical protein
VSRDRDHSLRGQSRFAYRGASSTDKAIRAVAGRSSMPRSCVGAAGHCHHRRTKLGRSRRKRSQCENPTDTQHIVRCIFSSISASCVHRNLPVVECLGQATASISRRAATLWTWIARRRAAGTCSLRRVAGRKKSRTSSWARQKRAALVWVWKPRIGRRRPFTPR